MPRALIRVALSVLTLAFPVAHAQSPKNPAPPARAPAKASAHLGALQKTVESFLRRLLAWGPAFTVTAETPTPSRVPGFYQVNVRVSLGGQSDTGTVFISADGRHLLRGEMFDTAADPFAETRSQLRLEGQPSKGPADAVVTLVEFSDFQCPYCRELHNSVRALLPGYPQVRVVFKDFPLQPIHPWAMSASIAARCAFQQDPAAFWKLHDAIFDNQAQVTPENVNAKLLEFAANTALDFELFRTCLASPEPRKAIETNMAEGNSLKITNTPTVFINGRRYVGTDRAQLQHLIDYELSANIPPAGTPKPAAKTP